MSKDIRIRKGLDIAMVGAAERQILPTVQPDIFKIKPSDFYAVTPKLLVKEGDEVKVGTPLFYHKDIPSVYFSSPVSGEVVGVDRGAKRALEALRILPDKEQKYLKFDVPAESAFTADGVKKAIIDAGLWFSIMQRPFSVVANPSDSPKAIFISGFKSDPLACDLSFVLEERKEAFEMGLKALQHLSDGGVHLTFHADSKAPELNLGSARVHQHTINGPHPSGNVGVQIHHIDPINKGEVVWVVDPQHVAMVGSLFITGEVHMEKIVALSGSQFNETGYLWALPGAPMDALLKDRLKSGETRVISGTVLSGTTEGQEGALGFYHDTITALPEGNYSEFFGWAAPGFAKFSNSRAYFSWLSPKKQRDIDTHMHGEKRAYVVTGQYEEVFPFDIYPVQLIKSIMIGDIEAMENLGIYEVAPEDFALCEVVCTSKIAVQKWVREGLDLVREETM